jgi:hypothetical protein
MRPRFENVDGPQLLNAYCDATGGFEMSLLCQHRDRRRAEENNAQCSHDAQAGRFVQWRPALLFWRRSIDVARQQAHNAGNWRPGEKAQENGPPRSRGNEAQKL